MLAAACGSPSGGAGAPTPTPTATPAGSPGTISGTVSGHSYGTVSSAWWIGVPDAAGSTVVYLFDKNVACSDLQAAGWDTRITNQTQVLELKIMSASPGTYSLSAVVPPPAGMSGSYYTLSATTGTPTETSLSTGTVTLTTRQPTTSATGSFQASATAGSLNGTFNASYCAGGVEP
jgi:hypothetical protein